MKRILFILVIIGGLVIGFVGVPSFVGSSFDEITGKLQTGDEDAVTERLSYIAELSVLDYKYSNAVSDKDGRTVDVVLREVKIPFTQKPRVTSNSFDRDTIELPVEKNGTMRSVKKELKEAMADYLTALYGENVKITFRSVE